MSALVAIVVIIIGLIVLNALFKITVGLAALIIPVIVWMVAGMLAGRLLRGRGYGPIGDVLLGLTGGAVGMVVLRAIGLGGLGNMFILGNIVAGVVGAVILVYVVRLIFDSDFAA